MNFWGQSSSRADGSLKYACNKYCRLFAFVYSSWKYITVWQLQYLPKSNIMKENYWYLQLISGLRYVLNQVKFNKIISNKRKIWNNRINTKLLKICKCMEPYLCFCCKWKTSKFALIIRADKETVPWKKMNQIMRDVLYKIKLVAFQTKTDSQTNFY